MSCSKSECLNIAKESSAMSMEHLTKQLHKCNRCVMYSCSGYKENIDIYKRTTRTIIGLQYAQRYFKL